MNGQSVLNYRGTLTMRYETLMMHLLLWSIIKMWLEVVLSLASMACNVTMQRVGQDVFYNIFAVAVVVH